MIYFKSGGWLRKLAFLISISLPAIALAVMTTALAFDYEWWYFGLIFLSLSVLWVVVLFFIAKNTIKRMMDPLLGLKITNKPKEKYFINIDFEREAFTNAQFKEYKEYYSNFYKQLEFKLNHPFNNL